MTSTLAWTNAAALLENALLCDIATIYTRDEPTTTGYDVAEQLSPVAVGVPCLVQTMTIQTATEGVTQNQWSVKVSGVTLLEAGHVVEITRCERLPELEGTQFLIESISHDGLNLIRKGVARKNTSLQLQGALV